MARPNSWPIRSHSMQDGPFASAHFLRVFFYIEFQPYNLVLKQLPQAVLPPVQGVQVPGDRHGRVLYGHVLDHLLPGDLCVPLRLGRRVLRARRGAPGGRDEALVPADEELVPVEIAARLLIWNVSFPTLRRCNIGILLNLLVTDLRVDVFPEWGRQRSPPDGSARARPRPPAPFNKKVNFFQS